MVEVDPWDAGYGVGYEHGYSYGYNEGVQAQRLASEVVEDWPGKAQGSN